MHTEYSSFRLSAVLVSVTGRGVVMGTGFSMAVTQCCLTAVIGRELLMLIYLQQCVRKLYDMTAQDSHANVGLVREILMPYDGVYEIKSGGLFNHYLFIPILYSLLVCI